MKKKNIRLGRPLCLLLLIGLAGEARGITPDRAQPRENGSPRLWVRSLSGATDRITVGRTAPGSEPFEELLPLSSSDWTEIARNSSHEGLRVGSGRDVVVVNATPRFDITAAEVGPRSSRPAATGAGEREEVLRSNQQASLEVVWKRGPLPVAFELVARHSSAEVQLRSGGKLVGFVNVASEKPASAQLDLRSLLDRRPGGLALQVDLRVLRGEISGMSSLGQAFRLAATPKSFGGNAAFNHKANWQFTGDAYYYINSAPASACGQLETYRNGRWLYGPGWLCTDGSGNATAGPWSWANTPGDQTDDPVYMRWPDGSTTNSLTHYWDKTCPSITRTSPDGAPPGNWYGTASDAQWGACFSGEWGTYLYSLFHDQTANRDWDPSTRLYSSSSAVVVYGTLSGMPNVGVNCGVSWSTNFPAYGAHTVGHSYLWQTCIVESSANDGCAVCTNLSFDF